MTKYLIVDRNDIIPLFPLRDPDIIGFISNFPITESW